MHPNHNRHLVARLEELKSRKHMLRRLWFTISEDVVGIKDQAACEFSSGDELLLKELVFHGAFNSDQVVKLTEELAVPLRPMHEFARRIAKVSRESKLALDEDQYVSLLGVKLMDRFEGSIVIVICRLGEQTVQAAKVIGNEELEHKFEMVSEMLERPGSVIFCSSLYL